ncbi:MAG: iron-containing alcohol dehydrogenase [Chloroflexota bacterium]|nr:iron-containing alcohol dehydrogenase [Chloroflexota bacterium]
MWFFNSPKVVFGQDALEHLEELEGQRAFFVTDPNIARLGFIEKVQQYLARANIESEVFSDVEPEPSVKTIRRCALQMSDYQPDWIIGLGGGSCMDAAKAAWLLYERPDADLETINPIETYGLRQKARLLAIPTTSGTGSEATWFTILTDHSLGMKLSLGTQEVLPDLAIVDPSLVMGLPASITADTGIDVLAHAIEGYTATMRNDFSDGLCLKAAQLVFRYLPWAYADGSDAEARERMHNAATIAGLGFGNAMAGLAHAMGHSLGAVFHVPHGRAVGLFLPYVIEFTVSNGETRYADIARFLDLPAADEAQGAASLVAAIRKLQAAIDFAPTLKELGIGRADFQQALPKLIQNAEADNQLFFNARYADNQDLERLFQYAFDGRRIDF